MLEIIKKEFFVKIFILSTMLMTSTVYAMPAAPVHRCVAVYEQAMSVYNQQVAGAQDQIKLEFASALQTLNQARLIQNTALFMCKAEAEQSFKRDSKLVSGDAASDILNKLSSKKITDIRKCEDVTIRSNSADSDQYNMSTAQSQQAYSQSVSQAKAQYDVSVANCK